MDEILTAAQIEERFDSEWVLVEDPETDERLKVQSGIVRCHSKDPDVVHRRAVELRPKRWAVLYIGKAPEGMHYVL